MSRNIKVATTDNLLQDIEAYALQFCIHDGMHVDGAIISTGVVLGLEQQWCEMQKASPQLIYFVLNALFDKAFEATLVQTVKTSNSRFHLTKLSRGISTQSGNH
ncbi:MAG: hypothetical protein NTV34_01950 [Proteobacteria bacterium]|nr:hypothetical protein [Pseudomonadota bacterium]